MDKRPASHARRHARRANSGVGGAKLDRMKLFTVFLAGVACAATISLPVSAWAQWQWVDKEGRKVFSDRPPPPDTPDKSILKQPGGRAKAAPAPAGVAAADTATTAAAPTAAASAPRLSGKDKELEEKKKQAEAAEAAKRKAEEEKVIQARADNCTRAKQSKASLDSGTRIARSNAQGEREYLDDAARAAETRRVQGIIEADCR